MLTKVRCSPAEEPGFSAFLLHNSCLGACSRVIMAQPWVNREQLFDDPTSNGLRCCHTFVLLRLIPVAPVGVRGPEAEFFAFGRAQQRA